LVRSVTVLEATPKDRWRQLDLGEESTIEARLRPQ